MHRKIVMVLQNKTFAVFLLWQPLHNAWQRARQCVGHQSKSMCEKQGLDVHELALLEVM
jgi:hypothetical protein